MWKNRLPQRAWCACLDPRPPKAAVLDLTDELTELRTAVSRLVTGTGTTAPVSKARDAFEDVLDETSDVSFALGRLAGGVVKLRFVPVPYANRHIRKITARMDEHGCVRSRAHLVNDRCPCAR